MRAARHRANFSAVEIERLAGLVEGSGCKVRESRMGAGSMGRTWREKAVKALAPLKQMRWMVG